MADPAERFIDRICEEARASSAVHHPYLTAFKRGEFPNASFALKDFAQEYGAYSDGFTRYLGAVIENLERAEDRALLLDNLAEEEGQTAGLDLPPLIAKRVTGVPHAELFARFARAVGASSIASAEDDPGQVWRRRFLALCQMSEGASIGAIGIGTELIVSQIYEQILTGLKHHSSLKLEERVFFDIHSHCDDDHAAQLVSIATFLARDEETRDQIEYGARAAIALRVEFWDAMLERAYGARLSSVTAG